MPLPPAPAVPDADDACPVPFRFTSCPCDRGGVRRAMQEGTHRPGGAVAAHVARDSGAPRRRDRPSGRGTPPPGDGHLAAGAVRRYRCRPLRPCRPVVVKGSSRLRWDSVAYGTAILTDRFTGFLLLPVLTSHWSRGDFGAWSQVLATSGLLSNILQLGFYHAIVRYVSGVPRETAGRVLHGMLLVTGVNCAIMIAGMGLFDSTTSEVLFGTTQYRDLVLPASIYIAGECLFEFVVLGFLRADRRILLSSGYYVAKNVGRLGLSWYVVTHGHDMSTLFVSLAGMQGILTAIVYVAHVVPTTPVAIRGLGRAYWYAVVAHSIPIVLSTNIAWFNAFLNRYVITHFLGLDSLASFAANYSIASITHVAAMVVTFTMIPRINAAWNEGRKSAARQILGNAVELYLVLAVFAGLAIGLLYPYIAGLLMPPEYHGRAALIAALLAFMVLLGLEQILVLATLVHDSRFSLGARALCLALNCALNLLVLVWSDLLVSILAACVAFAVNIGLNFWRLRAILAYVPSRHLLLDLLLASGSMAGTAWIAMRWFDVATVIPALIVVAASALPYALANCIREDSTGRAVALGLVRAARSRARF